MSDQGYSPAESGQEEEEDTGLFCQGCSPLGRKIGYYLRRFNCFSFTRIFIFLTTSFTKCDTSFLPIFKV